MKTAERGGRRILDQVKANGIHYTPPELARFLASVTLERLDGFGERLHVLDPACGGGILLQAVAEAVPGPTRKRVILTGYETDPAAIERARGRLADSGVGTVHLEREDFLSRPVPDRVRFEDRDCAAGGEGEGEGDRFDLVIANPPYVRTQVLGAEKSRQLAKRFGLSGRLDLYQAFARGMSEVLNPGGVLGLLTSNRFLTVKSGASLRRLLRFEFEVRGVWDLGDTRLFRAAVLPVIVVATKRRSVGKSIERGALFTRVYEATPDGTEAPRFDHVLDALQAGTDSGLVRTPSGRFRIERGTLSASASEEVWSLSTPELDAWLNRVRARQAGTIGEVATVKVGIKTTADSVFVRDDWESLPEEQRPEETLLHPLITHHEAARWRAAAEKPSRRVLYPHAMREGKRVAVRLEEFPRAAAYLRSCEERLRRRKYVTGSGREWYELWVPHTPSDWSRPKLVFPDISEEPRFFLDLDGSLVQGDCYWIVVKPDLDPDWLLLILAVANSSFITRFYDIVFHNKLYSGRRRFMTQYVKEFPLPPLESPSGRELVRLVRERLAAPRTAASPEAEAELDALVWSAFGLSPAASSPV